jgi:hypothetical protein
MATPQPPQPALPPSAYLAEAQRRLFALLSGQLPQAVETPQLGRVQFNATTPADLQRMIDYLSALVDCGDSWTCDVQGSLAYGRAAGRKPISFFAWP